MKKGFTYTAVFATGVAASALALKTWGDPAGYFRGADGQSKQAVLTALSVTPPATRGAISPVTLAAAKLEPAVVSIHTVGNPTAGGDAGSPFQDPMFRHFFNIPSPHGQGGGGAQGDGVIHGAGSGVIISPDGYVLTNDHVVNDTSSVRVNVGDKAYDARVVGTDPVTDIAVVKINTGGVRLTPAQFGNSDDVRTGDWAIAVGNPLDIGTSVTLGIISAINRTDLTAEGHSLNSVIQTDAPINPGNSGGALADIEGRVVGINEAIESPTGYYAGIGFAIPINSARKIAAELIRDGKAVHPYLGVSYKPLTAYTPSDRAEHGIAIQGDNGVVVESISAHSPAAQAGLKPGDVILQVDGQPLTSRDTLNQTTLNHNPGDTLSLTVLRDGRNVTLPITLRPRPADYGQTLAQPQMQPQIIPLQP